MTIMTSWELFDDVRAAQDEMFRTARGHDRRQLPRQGFQPGELYHGSGTATWAPAVDIAERKDAYVITVELPGVPPGDLEITLENSVLTIQGERHFTGEIDDETVHRAEGSYGPFRRSIALPDHVEADAIDASTQDGVLRVLVPKTQQIMAKLIPVRAGEQQPALTSVSEAKPAN
jgi:HSP20 family protein